ncbi:hypothetical protein WOC76_04450 [Methylocystis sp. IM3]|jgi:predicted DNA-binding transcriptional regulator|uniref:hypothetical protein n=1 Tax=unclassified Methylocystis TaxID=2625913 RepID=UPI0030F52A20
MSLLWRRDLLARLAIAKALLRAAYLTDRPNRLLAAIGKRILESCEAQAARRGLS